MTGRMEMVSGFPVILIPTYLIFAFSALTVFVGRQEEQRPVNN